MLFFLYLCSVFFASAHERMRAHAFILRRKTNMEAMKRKLVYCVAAALLLVGCGRHNPYENLRDRALPVEIEVVGESCQVVSDIYVGEIIAKSEIPLVFPMGGQLTGVYVKSGSKVTKGQEIASVDNTQAAAMLESAEAMLRQAEDAYTRLKPVYEQGGMSEVKWMDLKTSLEKAQSLVASSKKRYEDCVIRAAQDGVVNMSDVEVGQHLTLGQPIGQLLDLTGRKAEFTVPESEIGSLAIGDDVQITIPALDRTIDAKVDEKSLVSTRLAHTYRVSAVLNQSSYTAELLPGMVCRAIVKSKKAEGQIISAGCIQTQQQGHSVWVLRDGRAERQMVKIAQFVENGVLISDGLQNGDTVISKGYQKMYNGAKVSF